MKEASSESNTHTQTVYTQRLKRRMIFEPGPRLSAKIKLLSTPSGCVHPQATINSAGLSSCSSSPLPKEEGAALS
jgi:hypothetical protein